VAIRIGNSIPQDVKKEFDVEVGQTLGEELSETLKNATNDDGEFLAGSRRITDEVRQKVKRFFDNEFGNGEINTPELAKFLNSGLVEYFYRDHESEEGYDHNNNAIENVFTGEFGVRVNPEAKVNFERGVQGTGAGPLDLWDTSDPPLGMQLVGNRRTDLRFTEASLRCAAILEEYYSSDGWDDADKITPQQVNKLIENKYAFEFSSTNRGVLKDFIQNLDTNQDAKSKLSRMLHDAGN
jgi:hypothetical protein